MPSLCAAVLPPSRARLTTCRARRGAKIAAIKSAIGDLEQVSHAFSKTLYERGGAQAAGGAESGGAQAGPTGGSDDDAIDAEFALTEGGRTRIRRGLGGLAAARRGRLPQRVRRAVREAA